MKVRGTREVCGVGAFEQARQLGKVCRCRRPMGHFDQHVRRLAHLRVGATNDGHIHDVGD